MLTYAGENLEGGCQGYQVCVSTNSCECERYSVYLLYLYKSANTDTRGAAGGAGLRQVCIKAGDTRFGAGGGGGSRPAGGGGQLDLRIGESDEAGMGWRERRR
jgi:hypothetical protein